MLQLHISLHLSNFDTFVSDIIICNYLQEPLIRKILYLSLHVSLTLARSINCRDKYVVSMIYSDVYEPYYDAFFPFIARTRLLRTLSFCPVIARNSYLHNLLYDCGILEITYINV